MPSISSVPTVTTWCAPPEITNLMNDLWKTEELAESIIDCLHSPMPMIEASDLLNMEGECLMDLDILEGRIKHLLPRYLEESEFLMCLQRIIYVTTSAVLSCVSMTPMDDYSPQRIGR
ncbi:MAG: hypothetical protein H7A40_07235 [Chlamydiales bacterium]|nr:hypothetical protein [Chlamydiales bacterium]